MSIVSTLIDKARQRAGITSDSALAAQFGVHRQAVSKWRNGDAYPDEEHIAEMAMMAGDDPVQWLVAVKAVRADGKAGKAWASLARRLAAVGMALALGVGLAPPRDVQAAIRAGSEPTVYTLCEMADGASDTVRRLRLALAQALDRLSLPLPSAA